VRAEAAWKRGVWRGGVKKKKKKKKKNKCTFLSIRHAIAALAYSGTTHSYDVSEQPGLAPRRSAAIRNLACAVLLALGSGPGRQPCVKVQCSERPSCVATQRRRDWSSRLVPRSATGVRAGGCGRPLRAGRAVRAIGVACRGRVPRVSESEGALLVRRSDGQWIPVSSALRRPTGS